MYSMKKSRTLKAKATNTGSLRVRKPTTKNENERRKRQNVQQEEYRSSPPAKMMMALDNSNLKDLSVSLCRIDEERSTLTEERLMSGHSVCAMHDLMRNDDDGESQDAFSYAASYPILVPGILDEEGEAETGSSNDNDHDCPEDPLFDPLSIDADISPPSPKRRRKQNFDYTLDENLATVVAVEQTNNISPSPKRRRKQNFDYTLNENLATVVAVVEQKNNVGVDVKHYKCDHCHRKFTKLDNLKQHNRKTHRQYLSQRKIKDTSQSQQQNSEIPVSPCEICGVTFRTRYGGMQRHLRSSHGRGPQGNQLLLAHFLYDNENDDRTTDITTQMQDGFDFDVPNSNSLKTNSPRRRRQSKQYRCTLCKKTFPSNDQLFRHQQEIHWKKESDLNLNKGELTGPGPIHLPPVILTTDPVNSYHCDIPVSSTHDDEFFPYIYFEEESIDFKYNFNQTGELIQ